MHKSDKLGCVIFLGVGLWIAGTYALLRTFGDSNLIALLAVAGWLVLAALIIKFFAMRKND